MKKLLIRIQNLKFRNKLFLSYIITIIIPVAILGVYSYHQAKSFLLQQAISGMKDSVKQAAVNINYRVERYNSLVNLIAYNKRIQQIITNNYRYYSILYVDMIEQVDPLFTNVLSQNEDVMDLTLYTSNNVPEYGDFILSLDRIANQEWYQRLDKNGKTSWYENETGFFGARRIYNDYLEKDDVVYVRINPQMLFINFNSIENENYAAFISDEEGNVVFEINKLTSTFAGVSEKKLDIQEQGFVTVGDRNMMLVKSAIPEAGWILHFYVPVNAIALDAKGFIGVTVIIISVCSVFLLGISWIFSNAFVKRIHGLNKKIDLVRKGNLQVKVESSYQDEIGQLTSKFGEMLDNINRLISEVYQSKITQKEAELKALQAQINPHFLYNTLSIINWKAIEIDAEEISRLTVNVSNFYRSILNRGKNLLLVRDELENMKIYIDIKLIMHNYDFDVIYDIDEEITGYKTINIILQPIVENAIAHGIEKKEEGRGLLRISGRSVEEDIEFCVEDNGMGMDEDTTAVVLTKNTRGYGIKNVNDRIKIFFGQQYGIHIRSRYGEGTQVTIRVPKYFSAKET